MRLGGLTDADVEAVVAAPQDDLDRNGNTRLVGEIVGQVVLIVLASDDPTLVITAYNRGR